MQISREELQRRLKSERNIANGVEFRVLSHHSNHAAGPRIPSAVGALSGALARAGGNGQVIGDSFGIARQSVNDYKIGKTKAAGLEELTAKIKDTALTKLMRSVGLITDDKLEDLGAKDLSAVAVNMGKVVSNLTPSGPTNVDQVNLIVYSPKLREESKFKVVEVEN